MWTEIFFMIIGMALVTYLPRMLPLVVLLHRLPLPGPVYRWLGYVPVAVMAALLGPALAMPQGELQLVDLPDDKCNACKNVWRSKNHLPPLLLLDLFSTVTTSPASS